MKRNREKGLPTGPGRQGGRRRRINWKAPAGTFLSLSLLLSAGGSMHAAVADTGFADVRANAWYASAITYCRDNGLMQGISETHFEPETRMSRAMLTTVLHRASGTEVAAITDLFDDIAPDTWYTDSVIWALQNSLVTGYGDGRFGPDDAVTREQLVTLLWRYAGSPAPDGTSGAFLDESDIAPWAADAVAWAVEQGLVQGKPGGIFDPQGIDCGAVLRRGADTGGTGAAGAAAEPL